MPTYTTSAVVFRKSGLPSDGSVVSVADVNAFIDEAEDCIDRFMNTTFVPGGRAVTGEVHDGSGTNVLFLNWFGKDFQDANAILTLTSLTIDGTSITPSNVFVYPNSGKLQLDTNAEQTRFLRTKPRQIVADYSYGVDAVPSIIAQLTAVLAAMWALIEQVGGTFDDVTAYTLPEISISKGEPFTNIRETINQLAKVRDRLLGKLQPAAHIG